MREPVGRLKILDICVDPVNMDQAIGRLDEFLNSGKRPHSVFAVNPEKNFSVKKDASVRHAIEEADLLIPDGISIVIAARMLHGVRSSRVTGVDLMHKICELAAMYKRPVFVYGAKEEINRRTVERLREIYPSLNIVGRSHGYVKDEEMEELIRTINQSKAEILFVGLGSPKQEKWYLRHKEELKTVKICQGVGGTFDTIGGVVKRAPQIWQRCGVEWLYRLLSDPRRIKRQKILPVFAFKILTLKIRMAFLEVISHRKSF